MLASAHAIFGELYTAPASEVDYELVRAFVLSAEDANLFSESLTFEVKEKLHKSNVAEAIAALNNTDGGIVLVSVKDKDATGEDRIVGVPKAEHDAVASNLHALIASNHSKIVFVTLPNVSKEGQANRDERIVTRPQPEHSRKLARYM